MSGLRDILPLRWFRKITNIAADEMKATLLSFAFIFMLMVAYNILKPVRDAMAPEWSDLELASLWGINFVFSTIAVIVYGFAVSTFRLKNVIPGVYVFFAASFALFYFVASAYTDSALVNKAFYVWISVFSLFHVSVFWGLMADLYTKEQAPRLFGFIASGGSIGVITGASMTLFLVERIGTLNIMLVAATILVMIIPLISILRSSLGGDAGDSIQDVSIRGNPFGGFVKFVTNPYLLGIALFIFLYTFIGSFVYFELKNLMSVNDRDTNAAIWAGINLSVNIISIATAMLATSRITKAVGLGKTLAMIPLLVSIALLAVFASPVLAVIIAAWVTLKAGNYSITKPGREMLYTNVSREDRFKTKQVIDIVVYRGGDVFSGFVFALLTTTFGLGMGPIALIGAGVAIMWAYVGLRLGKTYDRGSGS
jgi:AAA family ATP:ADP antiporter